MNCLSAGSWRARANGYYPEWLSMTYVQAFWLLFIGIFIGCGLGVTAAVVAAIQFGYLPGVKFPWQRP